MIETVMAWAAVSPTLTPAIVSSASVGGDSHSTNTRIGPDGAPYHEVASACARTDGAVHWPAAPVCVHEKSAG